MRLKRTAWFTQRVVFFLSAFVLFLSVTSMRSQTTGQGALEGSVLDATGSVIPNAIVTATNQASGVASVRKSSGAGLYNVTPLLPGVYTVTATAPGFQTLKQENIEVNGLTTTGLNLTLQVGSASDSVTVTTAPPLMQTTSATVGAVITNETYESLPLVMGGQQRDPTSFATLTVGAQSGTRAPIFSGTGDYLAEVYIDGIPTTTIQQQGDNRVVSNGVPVEAVEQLQVISSAPSAEYQGAGAINLAIKTGGDRYHGQLVTVIRNTAFDTWGFAGNQRTQYAIINGVATQVPAGKAAEHQLEVSASAGGPIPFTHKKGFFFANYDQFHGTSSGSSALFTVPTPLMRTGDFTELGTGTYLYNPTTNACPTATTCSRQPFQALKNGVLTNNILPTNYLSSISQYEQKFLPNPNLPGLVNNYLTTGASGYANHEIVAKVTYDLTPRQRLAFAFVHGVRGSIGYGATLPLPYTAATSSVLAPTFMFVEHNWVITSRMVNQFTYGYTRFAMPVNAPTYELAPYRAGPDVGIGGLPEGQAGGNFPSTSFSTSAGFINSPTTWVNSQRSYVTVPNSFDIVDNFVWTKGQHNLTIGFLMQWLQSNAVAQLGASGIYTQAFSPISTANFSGTTLNTGTATAPSGYGYASFLLGAVNSGSTSVPSFTETGSRFRPISPYIQDDWKITPKLTANLGLRWDYLPSYREVLDRWSFLNPSAINPLTNSPGQLEFAGYRGSAISCECHSPVPTWKKNFGPRLGIEYAPTSKTVFRVGYAIAYSHAGGVGGRGSGGPSTLGYSSNIILPTAVTTGAGAGPSYYLNNSQAFQATGLANTNFGGPGYVVPLPTQPNASALTLNTGNYVSGGKYVTPSGAPPFVDPYLSSRAPMFEFYNLGVQQAVTRDLTVTLNYSGSQSHFVAGATVPGYWSGQIDPAYVAALGSTLATDRATNILNAQATAANIAIAQAADPAVTVPYPGYAAAGAISTTPKIGRMLQPFPQYSSPPSSTYANIANISYNALELTVKMRAYKGINFTANYTWSRNIGDDGTTRSAFPVPAVASSNGVAIPGNNRSDRDVVTTNLPHNLNIFGVFKSPFGKNKIGSDNWIARNIAGGWDLSEIFTYRSGTGIYVVGSGCTFPSTGTCMPDLVANRRDSIRKNGNYNVNQTYTGYSQTSYLDGTAFSTPNSFPLPSGAASTAVPITKIGGAPRFLGLRNPAAYNLNASLSRTFPLMKERLKFVFRADCLDVTNHVTFSMSQSQTWSAADVTNPGSTSFGKLTSASGNRQFQFTGRLVF
jgi:hypothetical protein